MFPPAHSNGPRAAFSVKMDAAEPDPARAGAKKLRTRPQSDRGSPGSSSALLPTATLSLLIALSYASVSTAAPFPNLAALKTAVDRCLAAVPSGDNCCSTNCGVAGNTNMPGWDTSW